jgi:hypothetical protein
MTIPDVVTKIENSDLFARFKEEYDDAYLAHAFSMQETGSEPAWQLGYYLPKKEKLVVFTADPLERLPEDEAFNKGEPIKKLSLKEVTTTYADAKEAALAKFHKEFPAEDITKVIAILQHLETQVYNFTLVTRSFNMCNVRVDAASGEIVAFEMRSIMSLRQSDEGEKK